MDTDVLSSLFNAHTWRQNVIGYRRAEQQRDRHVNKIIKARWADELGRQYMTLSNAARQIVIEATKDARDQTREEMPMFDATFIYTRSPRFTYKLKWYAEKPGNMWFQRHEHEPWFELGYFDPVRLKWFDTIEERERPLAFTASEGSRVHAMLSGNGRAVDIAPVGLQDKINRLIEKQVKFVDRYSGHTDHVHFALTDINPDNLIKAFNGASLTTEGIDMHSDSPEALEAAAAHAMARAAELRALDALEPTGDEPTISWTWTPSYEDAQTYTFVAFKAGDGRWYATGPRMCRDGYAWRDLVNSEKGAPLKTGAFHIVTEWAQIEVG